MIDGSASVLACNEAQSFFKVNEDADYWLCHSDARQVSDLPEAPEIDSAVYDRKRVGDPK
jgi:hypothetical protein